ncbi:uncharacterized protein LOC110187679 [Drosophila serrata]|uniref:uncharacterized protein LOC110187679 n=1 Tax=Drosophila serrata TaxID=7274 RepID=UPI000A1D220B|nr:uncharacterized protein LOC110187679 [Drosophila serrata]
MMEALDQQQTKLTSTKDAGDAGTGDETGARSGAGATTGAGTACSEEDDFEEPLPALGLEEEKETANENNNAATDGIRKKSGDDVIDFNLANGQRGSDRHDLRDGAEDDAEASVMEEADALNESPVHFEQDKYHGSKTEASLVEEQVDNARDELPENPAKSIEDESLPDVTEKAEVTPPPVIDLETDSESGAEDEFLSLKDPKSPAPASEKEVKKAEEEESQASSELYKDPVGDGVSTVNRDMDVVQEKTLQPTGEEGESDTVDSPSLTMDLDHVDLPSSENGDAQPGAIKLESESEEEHLGESGKSKSTAPAAVVPPIKLNGAHQTAKEGLKDEETEDAEELLQERNELEPEEPQQLSVITNHTGISVDAKPTAAPQQLSLSRVLPIRRSRSRSTSCGSSTISSASQPQLVIDHPETDQSARVPTLRLSMKRRRSKSSSISQHDLAEQQQQPKEESDGSSSLLLQRLQGNPNVGPSVAPANSQFLNCAKCNGQFEFESFQQLNEHQAHCQGPASSVSTGNSKVQMNKERFFRCRQCKSVFQCWNFFKHMRDAHQLAFCMYCSHVFHSAEKLSLHLENKHDIDQRHFEKQAWMLQREQRDRASHFICCTCQSTFLEGTGFETHDCLQFIQPCTLCGQKGGHAVGCRNNKRKPPKRRRKLRKPPEPSAPPLVQNHVVHPEPVMDQQPQKFYQAENIPTPGPVAEAPAPSSPKLVVPKIMLRVPKEFQKSVDAALSSTDTEEEEMDVSQPAEETAPAPSEDVPMKAALLEDLATEAAPTEPQASEPPPIFSFDDSPAAKLNRVLAELERTKLDIERTKADIITKKQAKAILAQAEENMIAQAADAHLQQQPQPEEQRRWSLTPPASPHNNTNNHMNLPQPPPPAVITEFQDQPDAERRNSLGSDCMDIDDTLNGPTFEDNSEQQVEKLQESLIRPQTLQEGQESQTQPILQPSLPLPPPPPLPPADGILVAGVETPTVDLQLDRPLDRFSMVDFVRLCLKSVYSGCLYCNHARRIAVNGKQLVLHLISQHRFTATVDSITAEELYAETIVARLKSFLPHLEQEYLNSASCCSVENGMYAEHFNERIYECFTCRFVTSTHKELYTHNRRLHIKSNITCVMCQMNFYSYSEILCHICPGEVGGSIYDLKFRCCLCEVAPLPSAFRLMVHLRKQHQACDICLEDCQSQSKLSAHVWKHKLLHLCYRCGIAYRNKQDISKHLFWKHGTESASCKRCLQKRWRHVYHFCVPPVQFPCEQCGFNFSKAIYLEVHQRMHSGDFRYACAEEGCEEKFVSRKLLLNHASSHVVKELPQEALMAPTDEDSAGSKKLEETIKKESGEEGEELQDGKPAEGKPVDTENKESLKETTDSKSENRKRRKKSKRSKESLEDLNLIAPNLSESDSSDDSDSDAPRSSQHEQPATLPMRSSVDDLDMPKVMLSPSSESDADETMDGKPKLEDKEQLVENVQKEEKDKQDEPKTEGEGDSKKAQEEEMDVSIWKNLLQNQAAIPEETAAVKEEEIDPNILNHAPAKIHVAWSDHDYCKLHRTPPPSPVKPKSTPKSATKRSGGGHASSDSDSSSCSSSSDSDSSSCSCGTNCSCSSSNSSSSSDDSDDSDSSNNAAGSPQKRARKKSLKHKKSGESLTRGEVSERGQEDMEINVTALNDDNPAPPPSPQPPIYNESDFDTAFSETDEEFYDPHPQKLANELLTQKREALLAEHAPLGPSNNYDIVENSRPSTPSLPEEALAFADKRERVKNKKKKRERKSTCKSGKMPPMIASTPLPMDVMPGVSKMSGMLSMSGMVAPLEPPTPVPAHQQDSPLFPVTPLTHRHLQPSVTPRSEGSSCSDADGQLKRSKRQRRPNKFYGYTSDDENMSTILAPPLQVGMQLIKPQPPPQLTWAKEDLPTPPKQRSRNNNNSNHHHSHSHSNGGTPLAGSSRKRSKQRSLLGASGSRPAKRHKPDREDHLPPIPTLKIRPSLLPAAPPTDSSDSSSDDEDVEVNVTSLVSTPQPAPLSAGLLAPPVVTLPVQPPPPPTPAATAFNQPIPPALLPNPGFATLQYFKANNIRYPIRPPAGARLAREGESVYCYCRCPYDEVSEMIACDGDNCLIEWFHFECVGIMVAPQGKWFCAECRPKYSEGSYQGANPQ